VTDCEHYPSSRDTKTHNASGAESASISRWSEVSNTRIDCLLSQLHLKKDEDQFSKTLWVPLVLGGWTIAIYHRRNPVKPNISVTNIKVEWTLLALRILDIPSQQKKHPVRFFTIFVSITQANTMIVSLPHIRSRLFPSKSPPMHYLTAVLPSTLHRLINNHSLNKSKVNIFYKLWHVDLETSGSAVGWNTRIQGVCDVGTWRSIWALLTALVRIKPRQPPRTNTLKQPYK
jgi:hypothetical protein